MTGQTILVVDDEPDIRQVIQDILEDESYIVVTADSADNARRVVNKNPVDLVLLDIWMPGSDGISLLKEWGEQDRPDAPVVMISGHGNVETAVEAIRFGAYDFLEKPLSTAKLLVTVNRALQSAQLRKENQRLRRQFEPTSTLIGGGQAMRDLRRQVEQVAKTNSWVLITGEPGSGKGVVARALHNASDRRHGRLVELSLAAIPNENLAAQLFGSESGDVIHPGRFEEARGGTLVLDEIADTSLDIQAKLLSALEDSRFLRVGGQRYIDIDVRIIAITNQNLAAAVSEGRFREDLYYRLNVVPLHVPPLREHVEDVPELVNFYLDWMVEEERLRYRKFPAAVLAMLRQYHWPGNVRELKNLIQRLLILNHGDEVSVKEVGAITGRREAATGIEENMVGEEMLDLPLREARDRFERSYLLSRLHEAGGNVSDLADLVGMERTHLYRKLKTLEIDTKSVKRASKANKNKNH